MKKIIDKLWQAMDNVSLCIFKRVCKLIHKEPTQKTEETFQQFVKFGVVGVSNTLISYIIYTGSLVLFQILGVLRGYDYIVAQVIQFFLSVLWSFFWNNNYVFGVKEGESRSILPALLKTYVSYSFTGLFLNTVLLIVWVDILHITKYIAPLINLTISVPLNFIISKFWAFKKDKGDKGNAN